MDGKEYMIWQRVLEEPRQGPLGECLHRMAQSSRQALRDYRILSEKSRGSAATAARQTERWERENLSCIRGLFALCTGQSLRPAAESMQERKRPDGWFAYQRALEQLQEYTALSAQPCFGVVFGEMARRQALICEAVARILGEGERM